MRATRLPVLTSGRNIFLVWVNGINITGVTVYVRIALCVSSAVLSERREEWADLVFRGRWGKEEEACSVCAGLR